jgi:cell division protein FtsZ
MVKIKVIGIGGAGCNAISRLKKTSLNNVELIAINTDLQQLSQTLADFKLQIGKKITQGLGTGMKPEIGEEAAKESIEEIREVLKKTDLLFLVFGGGGGTGTGAAPVIAEVAKNQGILTLAVVATPFSFEGKTRRAIAKEGIEKLKNFIDGIIVVENDRLLKTLPPKTSLSEAFWFSDSILQNAVKSILNILTKPALIGINFADIKEIFEGAGTF